MSLEELYQEVILDHYRNPRSRLKVINPTASCCLMNPMCGDEIEVQVTFKDDTLISIGFGGHGCSISQAAASMMSELCEGKKTSEIKYLCGKFRNMLRGEHDINEFVELKDAVALQGVRRFSARVKCAMLAWEALEKCIEKSSVSHDFPTFSEEKVGKS